MIESTAATQSAVTSPPLQDKTVLVAGATGGIGEGVTVALLRAGARVVATGRSRDRLDGLERYAGPAGPGRLLVDQLDVGHPDSAAVRRELAERHGRIDGVVITIGNWGPPGRRGILDTSDETWAAIVADNLTSHFRDHSQRRGRSPSGGRGL